MVAANLHRSDSACQHIKKKTVSDQHSEHGSSHAMVSDSETETVGASGTHVEGSLDEVHASDVAAELGVSGGKSEAAGRLAMPEIRLRPRRQAMGEKVCGLSG